MQQRKRRRPFHIWSVFVSTVDTEAVMKTEMVYFDGSERRAQVAFAQAVMNNPHAYAVEVHRDLQLLVRVKIDRP